MRLFCSLFEKMEAKLIELQNGLRVIYKYTPFTRTVHCGYIINSGSRDDIDGEMGMAHFIEHMIFKGTSKRKTFHILNYLESVGGEINAYTTKEKTCLYASMVAEYFERATDLLTDITFNSTFPEKEISKEKQVISEEIDMYRNAPDEAIFEDFDDIIFPEHSLGKPILGTKASIKEFTKANVRSRMDRSFVRENVVFSIVGNVSEKTVLKVVKKYLEPIDIPSGKVIRYEPNLAQVGRKEVEISTDQAHEIIGGRAYPMRKELYLPFLVLNNLLGGPAMNSRLNLNIREKHGLSYSISSFYSPYQDSGMWGIYYACETKNLQRIRKLVKKELKALCESPLGIVKISQAKKQLIGQLTLGYENLLNQMLGQAKDLLDFGKISTFNDYMKGIESINAIQLQDSAREIFQESPVSVITYKIA